MFKFMMPSSGAESFPMKRPIRDEQIGVVLANERGRSPGPSDRLGLTGVRPEVSVCIGWFAEHGLAARDRNG